MYVALYKEDAAQASVLSIMDTDDGTVDAIAKEELSKLCKSSMFANVHIKNNQVVLLRYREPKLEIKAFNARLEDKGNYYEISRGESVYHVEKDKYGHFIGIDIEGTKLKYYFLNRLHGSGYCIESFA